jgi:hypothetical protein
MRFLCHEYVLLILFCGIPAPRRIVAMVMLFVHMFREAPAAECHFVPLYPSVQHICRFTNALQCWTGNQTCSGVIFYQWQSWDSWKPSLVN